MSVIQLSLYQPISDLHVILQWSLVNLLTTDSKLRTTCRGYRHLHVLTLTIMETGQIFNCTNTSRLAVE